jgi:hypothetical protein
VGHIIREGAVTACGRVVLDDPAYVSVEVTCADDEFGEPPRGSTVYRVGITGRAAVVVAELWRPDAPVLLLFAGRYVVRHEPSDSGLHHEVEADYVGLLFDDRRLERIGGGRPSA